MLEKLLTVLIVYGVGMTIACGAAYAVIRTAVYHALVAHDRRGSRRTRDD